MNELNIYDNFNYKKILKEVNLYFNGYYKWYNAKTVFAPKEGKYTLSIDKWNIRICYWDENSPEGIKTKELIKKFVNLYFSKNTAFIVHYGNCDFLKDYHNVEIILR